MGDQEKEGGLSRGISKTVASMGTRGGHGKAAMFGPTQGPNIDVL